MPADGIQVITNLPDFKRQMAAFSKNFEKNIVRSATNAAAQVFKKVVIAAAPRASGRLKRAIYIFRRRNPKAGTVEMLVSFRRGKKEQRVAVKRKRGTVIINRDAFYGRFLEAGWHPRGPGSELR